MSKRHDKIAFKQIVRLEWMNETLSLVLAGYPESEIRVKLDQYLSTQRQSGGVGNPRNKATYGMSLRILSCWFREELELEVVRVVPDVPRAPQVHADHACGIRLGDPDG